LKLPESLLKMFLVHTDEWVHTRSIGRILSLGHRAREGRGHGGAVEPIDVSPGQTAPDSSGQLGIE